MPAGTGRTGCGEDPEAGGGGGGGGGCVQVHPRTGECVQRQGSATPAESGGGQATLRGPGLRPADLIGFGSRQREKGKEFDGSMPSIFDQREQAYLDYANPQVEQKFGDTSDQLTFQLSRMGHGAGSSTGVRRHGRLGEEYDLARAQVADTAADYANQARQQVNNEKTRLISLLQSTADPSAITGQIGGVIDSIKAAPAFDPLGPLFQNATAGLGSYLDGQRYNQMARSANSVPIYGSGSAGSGRVVR